MRMRLVEISVGAFILLGILAMVFLVVQVSGLSLNDSRKETYKITAKFNNVSGLAVRAKVTVAGVPIGRVTGITIDKGSFRAKVDMAIDKDVNYLTTDSIAAIQTAGVLGEKYVSISVGGEPDMLTDGSEIRDTQSAWVLEDLLGKLVSSVLNK